MKVTLIHNPKAGSEDHSGMELVALFEGAGHEVRYWSAQHPDCPAAFHDRPDVFVAAGGDGTVRKVALALARRGIPMSILPLGTVNNIARHLGLIAEPARLIAGLESAVRQRFDLGVVAEGTLGKHVLVESFGLGLIPHYMRMAGSLDSPPSSDRAARDLSILQNVLAQSASQYWKIVADGVDASGEYLLVEMMNIRSIGAALALAPEAQCDDGLLELVLVSEPDRAALLNYIAKRLAGAEAELTLPTRRFQELTIEGKPAISHIDDQLQDEPDSKAISARIVANPDALEMLLPKLAAA